jgi:hypothetical protein
MVESFSLLISIISMCSQMGCISKELLHQYFELIVKVLQKANVNQYYFQPSTYSDIVRYDKSFVDSSIKDFTNSSCYICDENTLIRFTILHEYGFKTKTIIRKLAKAGLLDKLNTDICFTSMEAKKASDNLIRTYIFDFGLKPSPTIYANYGRRKDKTFKQKMSMFKSFKKAGIIPDFIDCWEFSEEYEEVIAYIDFYLAIGYEKTGEELGFSFISHGLKYFDYLIKRKFTVNSLLKINTAWRSREEKEYAIEIIKKQYGCLPDGIEHIKYIGG